MGWCWGSWRGDRLEIAEPGGGIGVMGGEKEEGMGAGVGFDGGVSLAGEAVAGGIGGELVGEQLVLGVADIGGEQDVMGIGF